MIVVILLQVFNRCYFRIGFFSAVFKYKVIYIQSQKCITVMLVSIRNFKNTSRKKPMHFIYTGNSVPVVIYSYSADTVCNETQHDKSGKN